MSRSNPNKKKRRYSNRTLLMFGEGLGEEIFLKYLRSIYSKNSGTSIKIRNGRGGNAVDIVLDAMREPGDFDRRIVILDNDKPKNEMDSARNQASKLAVELIENSPCLEATLLSILRSGQSFASRDSVWCKKEFESNYLDKKRRMDISEYGKFFPKILLDAQRIKILELNIFISLMEG